MTSKHKSIADILREHQGSALSTADVCLLLGYSKIGLHHLTKKGFIPHYRIGDRIKFDPIVLLEWWEERRVG